MKAGKYTEKLILVLICIILLVIVTSGVTYAKYATNAVFDYYLSSKGFYFESDDLETETSKITNTNWDGNKVVFNIKNYSNKYVASEADIDYEITCTIEEENTTKKCLLNGTDKDKVAGKLSAALGCINETEDEVDTSSFTEEQCTNYTWTYTPTEAEHYFEIIDTEGKDIDTATVLITAKATSPYKKDISAKYILTKDSSDIGTLSVKYEEKSNYENIVITNSYNEDKCLKLNWNADDLIIDDDSNEIISSKVNNKNYINEIIFKLTKKDSINYIFYKTDKTKTYTEENFTLVETAECE